MTRMRAALAAILLTSASLMQINYRKGSPQKEDYWRKWKSMDEFLQGGWPYYLQKQNRN